MFLNYILSYQLYYAKRFKSVLSSPPCQFIPTERHSKSLTNDKITRIYIVKAPQKRIHIYCQRLSPSSPLCNTGSPQIRRKIMLFSVVTDMFIPIIYSSVRLGELKTRHKIKGIKFTSITGNTP